MLLKSYSFDSDVVNIRFYHDIWKEIESLKGYFFKFAGQKADEAIQATFMHTIYHYDENKASLNTYIKSLARVITKNAAKEVSVDFLEQTLSEESTGKQEVNNPKVSPGNVKDFTYDLINNLDSEKELRFDIVTLALGFMEKFVLLCDALIRHDTSTTYYPKTFIDTCISIMHKYDDFNTSCINLYYEYEDLFYWFINIDDDNVGEVWRETDFLAINSNLSKRVKFINNKTGNLVVDADKEDWYIKGKVGDKRIVKINYLDIWNKFCDLIDSDETNELKFVIDNNYVIKTFGGSYSIVNPDLYNIYDLVRQEIVTNLIKDSNGRLINIGSENIYLLCKDSCKELNDLERIVRGLKIKFNYEDITDGN